MTHTKLTADVLDQFTGTDTWHQLGLNRDMLYTDGAKFVADAGGAHWLLDSIAIAQMQPRVRAEEFQVWKLTVRADRTATLCCEDGNGKAFYRQEIPFTDFPLDEVTLWFANNVICLPSEH